MAKFLTESEKANKVEDEIIRLAKLNSAEHANQYWKMDGGAAVKAFNEALDAAVVKLDRAPPSVEILEGEFCVADRQNEFGEDRQAPQRRLRRQRSQRTERGAGRAEGSARRRCPMWRSRPPPPSPRSAIPANEISAAADKLVKAYQRDAEIVGEGGDLRATTVSLTDGQAATTALLAVVADYIAVVRKYMAEDAASKRSAGQ